MYPGAEGHCRKTARYASVRTAWGSCCLRRSRPTHANCLRTGNIGPVPISDQRCPSVAFQSSRPEYARVRTQKRYWLMAVLPQVWELQPTRVLFHSSVTGRSGKAPQRQRPVPRLLADKAISGVRAARMEQEVQKPGLPGLRGLAAVFLRGADAVQIPGCMCRVVPSTGWDGLFLPLHSILAASSADGEIPRAQSRLRPD